MVPGAHDEKNFVVVGVFGLDGFVDGDRSVDVFLVPETVYQHDGNFEGLAGEDAVHGLILPPGVVAGMREDFAPEAYLLGAVEAAHFAG